MDAAHWPFLAAVLILATIVQTLKSTLWTTERAKAKRWAWYARKTLRMQATLLGGAFGFLPGVVQSTDAEGWFAAPLYYATAGVVSAWGFSLFRSLLNMRGLKAREDRTSMPPKP